MLVAESEVLTEVDSDDYTAVGGKRARSGGHDSRCASFK
jgi:hypothetical protein